MLKGTISSVECAVIRDIGETPSSSDTAMLCYLSCATAAVYDQRAASSSGSSTL